MEDRAVNQELICTTGAGHGDCDFEPARSPQDEDGPAVPPKSDRLLFGLAPIEQAFFAPIGNAETCLSQGYSFYMLGCHDNDNDSADVDDGLEDRSRNVLASNDPVIKHFVQIKAHLSGHLYFGYYQCRAKSGRNPPRLSCPLLNRDGSGSGCPWYMLISAAECKKGWLKVQLQKPQHRHECRADSLDVA